MKRWGTILCLCLLPMLLFSACAEATAQVDFVANKDVKKIFDDVHTVGYILDDIRKVDFYKEMQPNDSYTKKQVKSTKLDTTVTKYYRNEDLVYAAYEKGGKQMTECHLRSTHSNDLTVTYTDADGKRTGVSILCEDDKGSYCVTFDQGLNTQSPYGADRFTIWISPEADNATFNSECTYEAVYADGKLTCTLVSANYYDKKGGFKHFTHTTDKNGVTQESSQPIYNKSDANEAMIGDSVDILRHVEKWDGVEAAQVRMGTHAFSYTEKKDITYWYIDSQVRFLFRNKEKAAAFNARYGGNGVKTLKHMDAPYAVNFSRCNLQIASDCTFPGDQNLGEFAVTDFKNNPYYNVTFDADGVLTSFQKVK